MSRERSTHTVRISPRPRSRGIVTVASALAWTLSACADETSPGESTEVPLWPEDFASTWPEVRDCRLSPAEHDGFYIRVFARPDAEAAYRGGVFPFAEGAVIAKAEYEDADCTTLSRVSAMRKLPVGADPELGDWQWQRTTGSGLVLTDTTARSCAGCHSACSTTDFTCTEP